MGQQQSLLKEHGYTFEGESPNGSIVTKDGERFLITNIKGAKVWKLLKEVETLKETPHPHIMKITDTLEDVDLGSCYVVTKYGGSLAEKIRERRLEESEALSCFVEICIALKTIHQKNMLHKNLTPENIQLSEYGKVCLGGFWEPENSDMNSAKRGFYLPPEVFTDARYSAKSEIWSLGCVLYELCTQQVPFSAEKLASLITKITSASVPSLGKGFSAELCDLLGDMLNKDLTCRPTASEILTRPIILRSLQEKSQTTIDYLQTQLKKLKEVADNLDQVHRGTTIGSLTGGVIGAVGGITTIVGLILAPFTLGASLIVTGVGFGVGVVGGVAASASNITNIVNRSSNRKAVQSIIKEFDEKVNAVAVWLQEIGHSLGGSEEYSSSPLPGEIESSFPGEKQTKTGGLGKGLGTVAAEVVQPVRVTKISKVAAKASRAIHVAKVAIRALSAIILAFDVFLFALDVKEIHNIRQTKEDRETTSEILKFVQTVRRSADELQKVLDELNETIKSIEEETALEWDYGCMRNGNVLSN